MSSSHSTAASTVSTAQNAGAASVNASSQKPNDKTVTISFTPDWDQAVSDPQFPNMASLRPYSVCVVIGPQNTEPKNAEWLFEFNLAANKELSTVVKLKGHEAIPKDKRALLFSNGKVVKYADCVSASKFREDLKTESITIRSYQDNTSNNPLSYVTKEVRDANARKRREKASYIAVTSGKNYVLNITFKADSTLSKLVASQSSWRPIIYLRKKAMKKGVDEILATRLFTNFTTNWAQHVEPPANEETELKSAAPASVSHSLEELETQPFHSLNLPALDVKQFNLDIPLGPIVENFIEDHKSPVSLAFQALEGHVRHLAVDPKSPYQKFAQHLLNCMSAISQIPGWLHFQEYVRDPKLYVQKTKDPYARDTVVSDVMARVILQGKPEGPMDDLILKGQALMKKLLQRIDWLLQLQRQAKKSFDADLFVKVLAADRSWDEDSKAFQYAANLRASDFQAQNPQKFGEFRKLQRHHVQWPYPLTLLEKIQKAGFRHQPTMLHRDLCVCDGCGEKVSGWRAWHSPWSFHNYDKHPPSFRPSVGMTLQLPNSVLMSRMVTENNIRYGINQPLGPLASSQTPVPKALSMPVCELSPKPSLAEEPQGPKPIEPPLFLNEPKVSSSRWGFLNAQRANLLGSNTNKRPVSTRSGAAYTRLRKGHAQF